jgi:adenylosuccinate synthase
MGPADLAPFTPEYVELPGWDQDLGQVRQAADLPGAARAYLDKIAEIASVPVSMVSVGPERDQIVEIH